MQFVCRMYKLQHDEGPYFLHEHCQSELPWRRDCVEEIQEMTGAKLMSVRRGNCNLPSIEKPTVMVTNCPAIAFTLRVSAKARFLNKRYSEHLERNEHKSIDDLHEDISCGIRLNTSGKGWEQQRPAGMNNLERDSKQYDVLVMETSTQEKTVKDSDWCVPVKHVAKLSRMRGLTSTKTKIKFFVDPEEEDRDNDTTSDCLGSKQFALKDMMLVTNAVVVRLMACSGNEREISPLRGQVYVCPA